MQNVLHKHLKENEHQGLGLCSMGQSGMYAALDSLMLHHCCIVKLNSKPTFICYNKNCRVEEEVEIDLLYS
ncbi:hypothetical protein Lal_00038143 [Lupinus albus]|nr:hypothetical protein Lal_00038143 [Lupinus albus]